MILSAGVVVTRRLAGDLCYLLLRVYRHWEFPKGEVAPGEYPLETAIREVEEETSLTDLSFRWGTVYRETPVYGKGKVARYYLAESGQGRVVLSVSPELGRPEHHEFRWMDYTMAHRLLGPRLREILGWADRIVAPRSAE